jgi:hypothetical protein
MRGTVQGKESSTLLLEKVVTVRLCVYSWAHSIEFRC